MKMRMKLLLLKGHMNDPTEIGAMMRLSCAGYASALSWWNINMQDLPTLPPCVGCSLTSAIRLQQRLSCIAKPRIACHGMPRKHRTCLRTHSKMILTANCRSTMLKSSRAGNKVYIDRKARIVPRGRVSPRSTCQVWKVLPYVLISFCISRSSANTGTLGACRKLSHNHTDTSHTYSNSNVHLHGDLQTAVQCKSRCRFQCNHMYSLCIMLVFARDFPDRCALSQPLRSALGAALGDVQLQMPRDCKEFKYFFMYRKPFKQQCAQQP